jgi:lipoyl(octanoyl) transferase
MKPEITFRDPGMMKYDQAWDFQEDLLQEVIKRHSLAAQTNNGYFLLVEHPHVFTLGNSGKEANLLVNEDYLRSKGAEFYKINRGGDITYHGPGQIVGYPVIHLNSFHIGIREYVHRLEEVIILTLQHYGIEASRLDGAAGVWLDASEKSKSRKICAMGVRVSRGVTMHGFAFNINTDLSFYNLINPCGFTDRGVTSLSKELGREINLDEVKNHLKNSFTEVFECELITD